MTIRLTYAKRMVIFNICTSLCGTNFYNIRDVARLLGKFSSSLVALKMERLHYRSLERAIIENFTEEILIKLGTRWSKKIRGQFSTTDKKIHINILELETSLFGMKSFYKKATGQHILIHI